MLSKTLHKEQEQEREEKRLTKKLSSSDSFLGGPDKHLLDKICGC